MADPAGRRATYEDVLAAPREKVAEVVHGVLHLHRRPGKPHAAAATALGEELGPPFKRGRGGPGGWLLLFEPELHLDDDILVPDLAGSRRERMPFLTAARGVGHAWVIDPLLRTLEGLRLQEAKWLIVNVFRDDAKVRAEPIEAFELDLGILWADVRLSP